MVLKEDLLKQCVLFVNDKLEIIETIMSENRKALEQESKITTIRRGTANEGNPSQNPIKFSVEKD